MPFLVSLLKDTFSVASEELLYILAMWFLNHALHPSLLVIEGSLLRVTNQLSYPSSSSDKIYAVAQSPATFFSKLITCISRFWSSDNKETNRGALDILPGDPRLIASGDSIRSNLLLVSIQFILFCRYLISIPTLTTPSPHASFTALLPTPSTIKGHRGPLREMLGLLRMAMTVPRAHKPAVPTGKMASYPRWDFFLPSAVVLL